MAFLCLGFPICKIIERASVSEALLYAEDFMCIILMAC